MGVKPTDLAEGQIRFFTEKADGSTWVGEIEKTWWNDLNSDVKWFSVRCVYSGVLMKPFLSFLSVGRWDSGLPFVVGRELTEMEALAWLST